MLFTLWLACTSDETTCKADLARIEVHVTAQETGEPIEGATVELDGEPCVEEGGGTYVCDTGVPGAHQVFAYAPTEYAAQTVPFELPEYSCSIERTVDVVLLPAMA
ncbi:MAG: hypothetical protein ABMA64_26140 [Myxococcota bacterium]